MSLKKIGGVFPFALGNNSIYAGSHHKDSVWKNWTSATKNISAFRNARSAILAVVTLCNTRRVWLPAYICPELAEAMPNSVSVVFYPVTPSLDIDVAHLAAHARANDAIVAADYFGRTPHGTFTDFVKRRPDIHWIEDRAQALAPQGCVWGQWVVYSPRKLFGVPDGGIVIGENAPAPQPLHSHTAPSKIAATFVRKDVPDDDPSERWYNIYRCEEAGHRADDTAMSPITKSVLEKLDFHQTIERRRANYVTLNNTLREHALWKMTSPDFAPLGYPVLVPDPAAFVSLMAAQGIYCPRHWARLPSESTQFPDAWFLASRLVTVPCDQRYGIADMTRAAQVAAGVLAGAR